MHDAGNYSRGTVSGCAKTCKMQLGGVGIPGVYEFIYPRGCFFKMAQRTHATELRVPQTLFFENAKTISIFCSLTSLDSQGKNVRKWIFTCVCRRLPHVDAAACDADVHAYTMARCFEIADDVCWCWRLERVHTQNHRTNLQVELYQCHRNHF